MIRLDKTRPIEWAALLGLAVLAALTMRQCYTIGTLERDLASATQQAAGLSLALDSTRAALRTQQLAVTEAAPLIAPLDRMLLNGEPVDGVASARLTFEGKSFVAFSVDLRKHNLRSFTRAGSGVLLSALPPDSTGSELLFATNGGIFEPDYTPTGLYVEGGRELYPLNIQSGSGNFYLKPNGVLHLSGDTAAVRTTEAYAAGSYRPDFALQSGPMLLIDGDLHPAIRAASPNFKLRSGVGVRDAHTLVFVISEGDVRFYQLAMVFKELLGCRDALYLDGVISEMYVRGLHEPTGGRSFAHLLTVYR